MPLGNVCVLHWDVKVIFRSLKGEILALLDIQNLKSQTKVEKLTAASATNFEC